MMVATNTCQALSAFDALFHVLLTTPGEAGSPSLSSPADEKTGAQRNGGHRRLAVTEPRCKLRAVHMLCNATHTTTVLQDLLSLKMRHKVPSPGSVALCDGH